MDSNRNNVYVLPCKPGSIYINITDKCLNECLFCIKRDGFIFYGCDLSLCGQESQPNEIVSSLVAISSWEDVEEMVFCGMGEPLLRYDCVVDVCKAIRQTRGMSVNIRVDTSGLFWSRIKRLDILDWIDILSISLNAENGQKYEELCRPKIKNAYHILMGFLYSLKKTETDYIRKGLHFPDICLSIVDTSEEEYIPASGRRGYAKGTFPVPDFDECERIASDFGWPLIVKRLFRDSCDERWNDRLIMELCAQGVTPDVCANCLHRH